MLEKVVGLISIALLPLSTMALPYYISGQIETIYSDSTLLNDEVLDGDTFEITFDYHPETSSVDIAGLGYQVYAGAASNLVVKINGSIIIQDSNPLAVSYNQFDPFTFQSNQVFGLAFNSSWDERGNADYWGLPLSEYSTHFELNLVNRVSPEFSLPETLKSSYIESSSVRFAASLISTVDIHGRHPVFFDMTQYYDIVGSIQNIEVAAVPEPDAAWLLMLGLASVIYLKHRPPKIDEAP